MEWPVLPRVLRFGSTVDKQVVAGVRPVSLERVAFSSEFAKTLLMGAIRGRSLVRNIERLCTKRSKVKTWRLRSCRYGRIETLKARILGFSQPVNLERSCQTHHLWFRVDAVVCESVKILYGRIGRFLFLFFRPFGSIWLPQVLPIG